MDFFDAFSSLGSTAVPIIGALNGSKGGGKEMQAKRNEWSSINGSGPNDTKQAKEQSPRGMWDYLLGRQDSGPPSKFSIANPLVLLGAGLLLSILVVKFIKR